MPAMTNLVVNDDTSTATVQITFNPITDTPDPFWRAGIAGVPLDGQPRVTASWKRLKNGNYKASMKLEVPVMETLGASGASSGYVAPPKVAYVNTIITSLFADKRSTISDRANVTKMGAALLAGANATAGTFISPNTATSDLWKGASNAPITQLFINGLVPN